MGPVNSSYSLSKNLNKLNSGGFPTQHLKMLPTKPCDDHNQVVLTIDTEQCLSDLVYQTMQPERVFNIENSYTTDALKNHTSHKRKCIIYKLLVDEAILQCRPARIHRPRLKHVLPWRWRRRRFSERQRSPPGS